MWMRIEDNGLVPQLAQLCGAGETRWSGTDESYAITIGCSGFEQLRAARDHRIDGVALQSADLHRLFPFRIQHTRSLAQHGRWANTGTTLSKNVGAQDGFCRAAQVAGDDLADELRNVDPCRTSFDTWCVMAEEAARSLLERLRLCERRIDVRKISFQLFEWELRNRFLKHESPGRCCRTAANEEHGNFASVA